MSHTLITAITDGQKKQIKRFAEDAIERAIADSLPNKSSAQELIENGDAFQSRIMTGIRDLATRNRFANEEVRSSYEYLGGYSVVGIAEQVNILRHLFLRIGRVNERLTEQPPPPNAEGWFAIPRWKACGTTYCGLLRMFSD